MVSCCPKAPAMRRPLCEKDISIKSLGIEGPVCQVDAETTWLLSPTIASHFPSSLNRPTPEKPTFPSNSLTISPEARSQTLAERLGPGGRLSSPTVETSHRPSGDTAAFRTGDLSLINMGLCCDSCLQMRISFCFGFPKAMRVPSRSAPIMQ